MRERMIQFFATQWGVGLAKIANSVFFMGRIHIMYDSNICHDSQERPLEWEDVRSCLTLRELDGAKRR